MPICISKWPNFELEWNTATKSDWSWIEKSYIESYKDILYTKEKAKKAYDSAQNSYQRERNKILTRSLSSPYCIQYLMVRFHEQPIGFFSCQLNYKTARVYMRWMIISPEFQKLKLGNIVLDMVNKHFPQNRGMELFTCEDNTSGLDFYHRLGFTQAGDSPIDEFNFEDPEHNLEVSLTRQPGYYTQFIRKWVSQNTTCCPPEDEWVSSTKKMIGLIKKR